jgi:hypothetical protein
MKRDFIFCAAAMVAALVVGSANANYLDDRKVELEAEGLKMALLSQKDCRSDLPVGMGISIKNGHVIGAVYTSSRNNTPEMTRKAIKFELPIQSDGTFGSEDEDFSRYWLRNLRSGEPKYQWLSGAVKDTEIEIKLTYGGPSEPNSYCFAAGSIAK